MALAPLAQASMPSTGNAMRRQALYLVANDPDDGGCGRIQKMLNFRGCAGQRRQQRAAAAGQAGLPARR